MTGDAIEIFLPYQAHLNGPEEFHGCCGAAFVTVLHAIGCPRARYKVGCATVARRQGTLLYRPGASVRRSQSRDGMKKILIYPYQLWVWLVFAPYLAFSTLFFALSALVLVLFFGPRTASTIAGVTWSRLICFTTPVFVKAVGKENIQKGQSYVVVANHQSLYDIVVLYGWLGIDIRWIMKKELRKVPGLGIACEKIGHIFIDRSNSKRAIESLDSAKQKLVDGTSVIFFPEGTRSKTGELGGFKKGAFKLASDLGLPILPVTIAGTREMLQTKSLLLFPGKVTMTVHPPMATDTDTPSDLMARTREVMATALQPAASADNIRVR